MVYALKIMDKKFITKENKTSYVKLERIVLDQLVHPGVIQLFFTFQDSFSLCKYSCFMFYLFSLLLFSLCIAVFVYLWRHGTRILWGRGAFWSNNQGKLIIVETSDMPPWEFLLFLMFFYLFWSHIRWLVPSTWTMHLRDLFLREHTSDCCFMAVALTLCSHISFLPQTHLVFYHKH